MAHECPECGQMCYYSGDIDDCCNNFEADVGRCVHYLICEADENGDYEPDDYATMNSFDSVIKAGEKQKRKCRKQTK